MTTELHRPLARTWWLRRATYFRFMARELTSLAVLAYSVLMIWGLFASGSGRSFQSFHEFLTNPVSVWVHQFVMVVALFHTGTWIALTPKVLVMWRDDDQIEPDLIAGVNAMLFVAVTGVVLWLVLR